MRRLNGDRCTTPGRRGWRRFRGRDSPQRSRKPVSGPVFTGSQCSNSARHGRRPSRIATPPHRRHRASLGPRFTSQCRWNAGEKIVLEGGSGRMRSVRGGGASRDLSGEAPGTVQGSRGRGPAWSGGVPGGPDCSFTASKSGRTATRKGEHITNTAAGQEPCRRVLVAHDMSGFRSRPSVRFGLERSEAGGGAHGADRRGDRSLPIWGGVSAMALA